MVRVRGVTLIQEMLRVAAAAAVAKGAALERGPPLSGQPLSPALRTLAPPSSWAATRGALRRAPAATATPRRRHGNESPRAPASRNPRTDHPTPNPAKS